MKRLPPVRVFLLSLICCGCASAPVHYYTLMRPFANPHEPASAACCQVRIGRVTVPTGVDRPELVTRSGQDQAILLSNANWLAPLSDEIRGALAGRVDLKLRQASANEPGTSIPHAIVAVDVTRFESVPAGYVLVTASWHVQGDLPKAALFTCETTAQITVQSGVSALVQGYQQALIMIADTIARDLLRSADLSPHQEVQCPDG